jgi:YVTN family beta-propeller protein
VLTTVGVGREPCALCYNPRKNKVYCADGWGGDLTIIDCRGDTVLATLPVGHGGRQVMCYNLRDNKVYCAGEELWIIDGTGNSVRATVPVSSSAVCYNPVNDKVYCNATYLDVIDGAGDSLTAIIPLTVSALCYDSRDNTVFCAKTGGGVAVLDGASNMEVATVEVGQQPSLFCYDSLRDKMYCVNEGSHDVSVIYGGTNAVVATISTGTAPVDMVWDPARSRMYLANFDSSSISVLRDSGEGIEETPNAEVRTANVATVVRGILFLPAVLSLKPQAPSWLLDISGRRVLDLRPGANDVSRLSPGVYFVREERGGSREQSAVSIRRVVITR